MVQRKSPYFQYRKDSFHLFLLCYALLCKVTWKRPLDTAAVTPFDRRDALLKFPWKYSYEFNNQPTAIAAIKGARVEKKTIFM